MKKLLSTSFALSLGFLLLTGCDKNDEQVPVEDKPIVESQFLSNAEGWQITGDAQGGYAEALYSPDGGVTGGHIYADDDVQGGVWYFTAPDSYLGDKIEYYGATLRFSLFQNSAMKNQFERDDIIFRNGSDQITYVHNPDDYPGPEWTNYSVKITAGNGWLKGKYNSGVNATEEEIKAVLSNLTEFSIRGEFETGPDDGALDNVTIDK